MATTKIEWATRVWNPITGCKKGCSYCYARKFAERMKSHPNPKIAHKYRNGFEPTVHREVVFESAKWRKPERVFVGSMGDLFDPEFGRPPFWNMMFEMSAYIQHTYMLLTKQPENMLKYANMWCEFNKIDKLPANIWCGVTVTNQDEADSLIPILLQVPAVVKFVSIEPMCGPIDILRVDISPDHDRTKWMFLNPLKRNPIGDTDTGIDWVIVGGMTGPQARPLHIGWVRDIRNKCQDYNIPFFFKGWGEYACINISLEGADIHETAKNWKTLWKNNAGDVFELIDEDGDFLSSGDDPEKYQPVKKIGRKLTGRLLDGREHNDFPE
jgi:protein gp37